MSNIHTTRFYRLITAAFLITGILVTVTSTRNFMQAQLTGPGSTVLSKMLEENSDPKLQGATIESVSYHMAAALDDDDTGPILVGMLLVLAGFSFHALYVVRQREPVRVHVTRERAGRMMKKRRK